MYMELISAFLGAILGAWINNRINWKINDRIKNLDDMTDAVFKMQFYVIKSDDEQENYKDIYINALATFTKTSNILMDEINLKNISDKTFQSVKEYNKDKTQSVSENYEKNLSELYTCIHDTRNKISSFSYIFKQLIRYKY